MTENETSAALKELAASYFADTPIPAEGEPADRRLTASKLGIPHFFSLRQICEENPALIDLVTVAGSAPTTSTLTTATGGFCPALFNEEL